MGDSENIETPPDLADRATVVQGMDVRVLLPHFCDSKRKLAFFYVPRFRKFLVFVTRVSLQFLPRCVVENPASRPLVFAVALWISSVLLPSLLLH